MYKNNSKKYFGFRFPATTFNFMLERVHSELFRASRNFMAIAANSIVSRLFSVINGLVPLILVQQITNQVNKFAVLFKRSMFSQDCRNRLCVMSGNDWCWGRWLGVCCNVLNASTFNVILRRERSELSGESRNKTSLFLNRIYHPGSSANELTLKAKDDYKSVSQFGRSMIEMLGVLAIIAVLSVGGIAGYSKAMTKWKINKAVNEYNFMIFGLLDHLDEIKKQTIGSGFVDLAYSLNLVPTGWKKQSDRFLVDDFNNNVQLFNNTLFRYGQINVFAFEIYFGQDGKGFFDSPKHKILCRELMTTLAKPLHEIVYSAYLWRGKTSSANDYLFGTKYCSGSRKCLADVTLTEIENLCRTCTVDNSGDCSLVLYF